MRAVEALAQHWASEADILGRYGDDRGVAVLTEAARQLTEALEQDRSSLLTPKEAAAWTGYSDAHLCKLRRDGTIRNYGTESRPRFRADELPIKPKSQRRLAIDYARDESTESLFRDIVDSKVGSL